MGAYWSPFVEENMHWYYGVRSKCGYCTIFPFVSNYKPVSYTAYLNDNADGFGGKYLAEDKDPRKAAKKALLQMEEYAKDLTRVLSRFRIEKIY